MRRIARLEESGVIPGWHVSIDNARIGGVMEAFSEVRFAGGTKIGEVESTVSGLAEVVEAFTRAGDPDALVRLRDLDRSKGVINGSGRVTGTKTLIVLGSTSRTAT
jgi:Lrp/AsnC family leucine-responsive transcriptional regulator